MTIDEAIAHAREVAKRRMAEYENHYDKDTHYYPTQCKKCAEEHIQLAEWLEELKQHRSIGTPEECRAAVEKQKAKKPIMKQYFEDLEDEYLCCPTCGEILTDRIPADNKTFYFHCMNCGQKFDWSDEE